MADFDDLIGGDESYNYNYDEDDYSYEDDDGFNDYSDLDSEDY